MSLAWEDVRRALAGRRLPAAFVDLDAFDRNLRVVLEAMPGLPLRVASKSVRVVALLRRLLQRGDRMRGLLCYAVAEADFLAREGFEDLLVAYPAYQDADLAVAAGMAERGVRVRLTCDSAEGIARVGAAARRRGTRLDVVLCVDMSLRVGGVHVGVRRSPLHEVGEVVAMARRAADTAGVRFAGLLAYEAQVAGIGDASPFSPLENPLKRVVRAVSARELGSRRAAMVAALRDAGLDPEIVNGGGTGSLDSTTRATGVDEVTAGSAFLKPHLFDGYRAAYMKRLEPAGFFALEVTRRPAAGFVTCLGGGYVASGAAGRDKVPLPWLPRGLELVGAEMCGEVQTPLRVPSGLDVPLGAPIVFRHAKAGELAERFLTYLVVRREVVVDVVPTYRGLGLCFF
jgi:D-serine deaminase-like pyridoxal phosphate-dependent protein